MATLRRPTDRRHDAPASTPDGGAVPSVFDYERHLFFWFTQVVSRRDRQLAKALKPYGVRVHAWRVLGALYGRRGLSMSAVADIVAVDPTTLSRTVAQLVRAGLVSRLIDLGDKRVARLALTAAGTRLTARILPVVFRLNESATRGLPEPMVDLMLWALREMRGNLDKSLAAPRRSGRSRPAA
ncbi:MAG TPA: MarR family winged helix-turn-helix transcriptional regulator [Alphaproteobacteria bacterium]